MTTVRELTAADAQELRSLYDEYEWWEDRETAAVRRALESTSVAVGIERDGELIAAARVLTDYVYYATIYDVIVASCRRGKGYGEQLLTAILDHPELEELPFFTLQCRENLTPFYESVGFEQFDAEIDVPEGGTEQLVRMIYEREENTVGGGDS